uniref:Retinol binding protein 1 n=1 Tax=Bos taurus TaxID=9913 RepID=A0AAA9TFY6_BOVIN
MPVDFTGYWKMLANENFEEYLRALDVNVALRKIANLLKPDKEIVQEGDHMIIRTLSTFRNYIMDFQVGKEFEEDLTGIDDRKCMPRPEGAAVEEGSKPPVNKDGKLVTWRPQLAPPRCLRKVQVQRLGFLLLSVWPSAHPVPVVAHEAQGRRESSKTTVSWDGDKLECVQKGEKEGRGWTQWIEGDELHLEMRVEGVVCKQVFKKVN